MRKYSTDRARAKEFGGTMHTSPVNSTNDFGSKRLGSTTAESTLVKILNSGATRMSYPYDETPYEMTPARSEEHTSELQSPCNLVCRLLLEKKKNKNYKKYE